MVTSNQLSECYKYIIQPQIRILIKKTLMCIYGRIFEHKQTLVNEDSSIFTYVQELFNLFDLIQCIKIKY